MSSNGRSFRSFTISLTGTEREREAQMNQFVALARNADFEHGGRPNVSAFFRELGENGSFVTVEELSNRLANMNPQQRILWLPVD